MDTKARFPGSCGLEEEHPRRRTAPRGRGWFLIIGLLWAVTIYLLCWPKLQADATQPVFTDPTQGDTAQASDAKTENADTKAPVIMGILDRTVYQGETISYYRDILVSDDQDPEPVLEVNSSKVDVTKPGVYFVTYTARDSAGNECSLAATVTVQPRSEGAGSTPWEEGL